MHLVLTGADEKEYMEALIRASNISMKRGVVIYVYVDDLFFYATDTYQGKFLAKCWPGGKTVSKIPYSGEGYKTFEYRLSAKDL